MDFDDDWTRLTIEWRPAPGLTVRNIAYVLTSDREWQNAERCSFLSATNQVCRSDYLHLHI